VLPTAAQQLLNSRLLRPLFLFGVLLQVLDALGSLQDLAALPLGVWFGGAIRLGDLVHVLVVLYLLLVGLRLPAAGVSLLLQRGLGISEGSRRALDQILQYVIFALGVIWAMGRLGINQTGVLAIAGGLSVGLGFGIKEVFSNFVSGLWLLFEGSVHPGDVLILEGDTCQVRKLGLRATTLWRDRDNAELVVPNQTFFTATATTYTGSDDRRRGQVLIGAGYQHDPELVISVLEEVARAHPRVLADPAPKAFLLDYGSSSIDYSLRFWMADPMTNLGISSELRRSIWHAFQQHDIEIPFPQRVVHQAR